MKSSWSAIIQFLLFLSSAAGPQCSANESNVYRSVIRDKCLCIKGYVRDKTTGNCIQPQYCPSIDELNLWYSDRSHQRIVPQSQTQRQHVIHMKYSWKKEHHATSGHVSNNFGVRRWRISAFASKVIGGIHRVVNVFDNVIRQSPNQNNVVHTRYGWTKERRVMKRHVLNKPNARPYTMRVFVSVAMRDQHLVVVVCRKVNATDNKTIQDLVVRTKWEDLERRAMKRLVSNSFGVHQWPITASAKEAIIDFNQVAHAQQIVDVPYDSWRSNQINCKN